MNPTEPNSGIPQQAIPNANDGETIARTILERAPVLVYVVDLSFNVILMNRELREISGWDTSKCKDIDTLLSNFYPDPDYRAPIRAIHDGWAKTPSEQVRDTVMVLTTADGRQRSISWTTSRLRVGRGPVRGYIAIGVDVTTRRNLEHWVTLFQQSLLQMNEALALTDPEGGILAWSGGATALLGHKEEEVQGQSLQKVFPATEDGGAAGDILATALASDDPEPFELQVGGDTDGGRLLKLEIHRITGPSGDVLAQLVQIAEGGPDPTEDLVDPAELEDALRRAQEAENALKSAEGALEDAKQAATEAETLRATAQASAEVSENERAAAQARAELADNAAEALRSELEEARATLEEARDSWTAEREELVTKHIAELDALVEENARDRASTLKDMETERGELEEQLRNDILAAEERAEMEREALEERHQRSRTEWDDAMAISEHTLVRRVEALKTEIAEVLSASIGADGALSGEGVDRIAQLIDLSIEPVDIAPSDEGLSGDLEEDDLVLDDEVDEALDSPPPVSPAMVATASELEAHQPGSEDELDSELELDPESDLNLDVRVEALPASDELELEFDAIQPAEEKVEDQDSSEEESVEDDLELELDEDELELEPESDELELELDVDSDSEPEGGLEVEPTEEDLDQNSSSQESSTPSS